MEPPKKVIETVVAYDIEDASDVTNICIELSRQYKDFSNKDLKISHNRDRCFLSAIYTRYDDNPNYDAELEAYREECQKKLSSKFENARAIGIKELNKCKAEIIQILSDLENIETKRDINITTRLTQVENKIVNVKNHFKRT